MKEGNAENAEGYRDGRNPDAPLPSANRSHSYRHSFAVGRAELESKGKATRAPPEELHRMADEAEEKDASA